MEAKNSEQERRTSRGGEGWQQQYQVVEQKDVEQRENGAKDVEPQGRRKMITRLLIICRSHDCMISYDTSTITPR